MVLFVLVALACVVFPGRVFIQNTSHVCVMISWYTVPTISVLRARHYVQYRSFLVYRVCRELYERTGGVTRGRVSAVTRQVRQDPEEVEEMSLEEEESSSDSDSEASEVERQQKLLVLQNQVSPLATDG